MKKIAFVAAGVALAISACSPQFEDLEGIVPQDPDSVTLLRNIDGFANINIVCLNGDAFVLRSAKYDDLQILHIPASENRLCE